MDAVLERASEGVVDSVLANGLFQVEVGGIMQTCHLGSMLRRVGVTIVEGERVTVRTGEDGVFTGEITQVRPALEPRRAPPREEREGLIARRDPAVLRPEAQRIDRSTHPGWLTGAEVEPRPGDCVYCTAGRATVHRVLGKTGNGSRLLELRLPGSPRSSFFAAASNVLLEPRDVPTEGVLQWCGAAPAVTIG
jgi:translation initiation factor IF-1